MYKGTSAELRPIATPAKKRPATITLRLVAAADSSGPASMGTAHNMKEARLPNASASDPPVRLPTAAPARVLLTTCTTAAAAQTVAALQDGNESSGPYRPVLDVSQSMNAAAYTQAA
jgi:hypothetical protein